MTKRDFYAKVIAAAIDEELTEFAKADIEKLLAIADDELYKEKQLKYRNRRISNQVL